MTRRRHFAFPWFMLFGIGFRRSRSADLFCAELSKSRIDWFYNSRIVIGRLVISRSFLLNWLDASGLKTTGTNPNPKIFKENPF